MPYLLFFQKKSLRLEEDLLKRINQSSLSVLDHYWNLHSRSPSLDPVDNGCWRSTPRLLHKTKAKMVGIPPIYQQFREFKNDTCDTCSSTQVHVLGFSVFFFKWINVDFCIFFKIQSFFVNKHCFPREDHMDLHLEHQQALVQELRQIEAKDLGFGAKNWGWWIFLGDFS